MQRTQTQTSVVGVNAFAHESGVHTEAPKPTYEIVHYDLHTAHLVRQMAQKCRDAMHAGTAIDVDAQVREFHVDTLPRKERELFVKEVAAFNCENSDNTKVTEYMRSVMARVIANPNE